METRARHVLIGLFTLAVTAAGFGFVYWLNTVGGLGARATYQVKYAKSVAGLLVGSPVLFNGMRVGEVTALEVAAEDPQTVLVTVAVEPATPVRQDTKVGIDFQGLTGAPAVALEGGSPSAPALAGNAAAPAVLIADEASVQSVSEAARQALKRIDVLIADNQEGLHNTISNLSKFSDALGRNSDRVDGILAGIERMTGGSKASAGIYDLAAIKPSGKAGTPPAAQFIIADPVATFALSQDKIMVRKGEQLSELAADARWSDPLVTLFQTRLIQSLENAGYLGKVTRGSEGATGGYQIATDIRRFELVALAEPVAEVEFSAKLVDSEGQLVAARVFKTTVPANLADVTQATGSLNQAFGAAMADLIAWTLASIRPVPEKL